MILAGDIGGTSTRLALFERRNGRLAMGPRARYPSRAHAGLAEIVTVFLREHARPVEHACFGLPGPVADGRVHTTNLPWAVDAADLAARLHLPGVTLLNDLEANAHGIPLLHPGNLHELNAGAPRARGNLAVVSAGTGLGEAGAWWDGERHHPFATEGGHADFAPADALQGELLAWLRARSGHVSWEHVVSGPGLVNVYTFLRDSGRGSEPPALRDAIAGGDAAAVVSRAALHGASELCAAALDLFVACYGAEAGNMALKVKATGGVYLGGGIAPQITAKLGDGSFMRAFTDKGPMRALMQSMPVRVILDDDTALLGAARRGALAAGLPDPAG